MSLRDWLAKTVTDKIKNTATGWLTITGYLMVIAVYSIVVVSYNVHGGVETSATSVSNEFNIFALFFLVAQSIERLLEPAAAFYDGFIIGDERKEDNNSGGGNSSREDAKQEKSSEFRAKKRIIFWTLATCIAMVFVAVMGLGLLGTLGVENFSRGLDILFTGLAVGAGTQPLNALIGRLQK